jgi:hypothetical protein
MLPQLKLIDQKQQKIHWETVMLTMLAVVASEALPTPKSTFELK